MEMEELYWIRIDRVGFMNEDWVRSRILLSKRVVSFETLSDVKNININIKQLAVSS